MMNTPQEVLRIAKHSGCAKAVLSKRRTLLLAIMAGVYIAMGGAFSVFLGFGFPEITLNNPGLQRMLSGMVFPIGLLLVVLVGAELFTGNNAVLIPGFMLKKFRLRALLRNWSLVYLGNFIGALFFAYFLIYLTELSAVEPWRSAYVRIAETKVSMTWLVVFLRGVGANWLVCLAVWMGLSAKTVSGKIMALWFPIFCFVALGFEHSIANMFFIPLGMMEGANVTVGAFVWDNLIPATLGNIFGGAFFVGMIYTLIYRDK